MSTLNETARAVHKNSADHGFWPEGVERNFGEIIALIHSEASEALEADRDGARGRSYEIRLPNQIEEPTPEVQAVMDRIFPPEATLFSEPREISQEYWDVLVRAGFAKPVGVPSELVDVLIRTLDALAGLFPDLDVDDLVAEKMAYNATRPIKHGKAY